MIIGSDFERVGYSWETKDDWFGEVPIEDDGSFVLGRNMPVDTRDLVHPNMAPRINRTKSKISDHLRAIDDMTSKIFSRFERSTQIKNLEISPCKSRCTFTLSGIETGFALIWFWKYSVNNTPINIRTPNNPNIFEDMCMTLFQQELQKKYPDCVVETPPSYFYSNRITISEKWVAYTYLCENKTVYLTLHFSDSSIVLWWDWIDDKEFKFDEFLKNLDKNTLGM